MFRRLLLAGVATAVCACAASAADLPVAPGPSYYPGVVTPAPYYNWTGIYLGGNVGAAFANQTGIITTDIPTGATIGNSSVDSTGFLGGGQIGFNWFSAPNFVIGFEGDFDALANRSSVVTAEGATVDGRLRFLSTARGRLGFTADRFMPYITGGFAWGQEQVTRTQTAGTINNAGPGTVETVTNNRIGWTAGGGLEYAIAQNWTARLEYLYVQLEAETYTFPLSQRLVAAPYQSVNEVRFGVNYKFDLPGTAPIRTRY